MLKRWSRSDTYTALSQLYPFVLVREDLIHAFRQKWIDEATLQRIMKEVSQLLDFDTVTTVRQWSRQDIVETAQTLYPSKEDRGEGMVSTRPCPKAQWDLPLSWDSWRETRIQAALKAMEELHILMIALNELPQYWTEEAEEGVKTIRERMKQIKADLHQVFLKSYRNDDTGNEGR